ncbi:unnamed protein product [Spirodela intermedia]|uniref:Transcription factor MYC/MYB N-terminal domain-containing protein n=1 Tax=Spirodela intermedia TaxID=51605 RepID=A0A7I8IWG6_SPIIN|nr:unnamed protein product [Spirodela intermedia]CAA6661481.1 unnamed protein product [Spirodela intermedia]
MEESLCIHEDAQWVYAVFWRILPRNYPPPKWDLQGGAFDRSRGNRRNWILVWEDGFCNFASSSGGCTNSHHINGLQPELFFKMSHEIYSYGEGLIGKVAADHSHKWIFREPQDHDVNYLSAWPIPHPRTWEAQFQCGIKTIALIAVGEGVVQLGSINKVMEDLAYVVLLRKRFNYLESIPGCYGPENSSEFQATAAPPIPMEVYNHLSPPVRITPSMSSLEALLSKLPPVCPIPPSSHSTVCLGTTTSASQPQRPDEPVGVDKVAKEELDEDNDGRERSINFVGQSSGSMACWFFNAAKPTEGL